MSAVFLNNVPFPVSMSLLKPQLGISTAWKILPQNSFHQFNVKSDAPSPSQDLRYVLRLLISRLAASAEFFSLLLRITPNKYLEWEAKQPQESLQGFDYDARLERFLLRPRLMLPARGALKGIIHWMRTAIERLGDDNPRGWSIVRNQRNALLLFELYLASVSNQDASISAHWKLRWYT